MAAFVSAQIHPATARAPAIAVYVHIRSRGTRGDYAKMRGVSSELGGKLNVPCTSKRLGKPRQHRQISMKLDAGKPANAERSKPAPVFEGSKLSLHGRATGTGRATASSHAGSGDAGATTSARSTSAATHRSEAPLGLPLVVGTRERPAAVLALASKMLAALDSGRLAQGKIATAPRSAQASCPPGSYPLSIATVSGAKPRARIRRGGRNGGVSCWLQRCANLS